MGVIDEGLYELAENIVHFQADASRGREAVIDICARVERIRIRFGQRECMWNCFRRRCNAGSSAGKPIWVANRQGICYVRVAVYFKFLEAASGSGHVGTHVAVF